MLLFLHTMVLQVRHQIILDGDCSFIQHFRLLFAGLDSDAAFLTSVYRIRFKC